MVRELNRPQASHAFPDNAPTAYPVFYRTYSRRTPQGDRETWPQVCARSLAGLVKLGKLTDPEADLIRRMQDKLWALPSGRWLWVGGTPWLENPDNFSGAYNCTSTNVSDWRAFGLMMDLAMMGCGTGAVLEPKYIDQLPAIRNPLTVEARGVQGEVPAGQRQENTTVDIAGDRVEIIVGDSRQGWVRSYQTLLELSSDERFSGPVHVIVDVSNIRPTGEPLKGFGGVANPVKVPEMYHKLTKVLNGALGRKLTSVECCLLIDEAAVVVVAGNVRRSAGMRQGISEDLAFAAAKENLWQQDDQGNWRIDPDRDSLRMANHSRVFHHKPTEEECVAAVRKQFYSGEGAIQWAGEAIARSNGDLVPPERKGEFIAAYAAGKGREWLQAADPSQGDRELDHRLGRYGLNPCVTADTWVHTEFGPRQVRDLIGRQHGTYVNGELFSTTEDGFFQTGVQPVLKVTTREGVSLRLTGNHRLLKVTSQTQKRQYTEWTATEALQPGDRLCLHNHRDITPWPGAGTFAEGWLLGSLVGDGSLAQTAWRDQGILRFWGDTQVEMAAHAIATLRETVDHGGNLAGHYHPQHDLHQVSSNGLGALAAQFGIHRGQKWVSPEVEQSSYDCHRGFLRGLFDADGSVQGHHGKGISVRLAQSSLVTLEAVQRMLLRLGIAARIYKNRRPAGMRMLPNTERTLAPYFCQAQHELVIANDSLLVFRDRVGFQQSDKRDKLNGLLDGYRRNLNRDRFTVTVQAIEPDGVEPVYDCTVPGPSRFDANGLVAHNCGEILGEDFHCVSGETMLVTRTGMAPIASLVGQVVEVWNGQRWSAVTPIQTGRDRALYRVRFGDGTYLDVTEGHRFFVKDRFGKVYEERTTAELIEQLPSLKYALHTEPFQMDYRDGKAINPIWAYTLGQLVGDGSLCQSNGKPQLQLRLYGAETYKKELAIAGRTSGKPKFYAENPETSCLLYTGFHREFDPDQVRDLKQMAEPFEAIATWNREAILHFIAGLIDADGSSVASGGVRLYLSGYDRAYRVYLLLLKCGIRSSVNLLATAGTRTNLGVRSKDLWYLQITDARAIPCQRVDTSNGHAPKSKGKWQVIRSIEPIAGRHDTFCFNEPEFHKGVFGGTLTGQCNLSEIHLNQIDPTDRTAQRDAFMAGGLAVASLLNHRFQEERYRYSREVDPIVGVSFTGLFDFFVQAFGVEWLKWWEAGRPETPEGLEFKAQERDYLTFWRETVHQTVWDYCDRHGLRRPNRCTTVQPSGTKSLLTGASPGWHPPKAARFIRRITFRKNDPVALACMDYGYSIVPSQSDKDEAGNLLTDPFDPRCTEWLVEIPVAVSWADLPGADTIAIEHFSALAQFDFYMQVQRHYTAHNCFARNTEFLTSEGVKTFESLQVGDTVNVLNADGDWVPATVVNTGDQRPMLAITICEGKTGRKKTITSTYCHRFPVRRPSGGDSKVKIVQAQDLKVGHRLVLNSADLPDLDEDGIRHGIVFGDGSLYKNDQGEYHEAQLYLCGGKRHLQSYFTAYERTHERDDVDQTRIYGLPKAWKFLPPANCSQSYLAGFIAGLLATDGSVFRSTVSISTSQQSVVDYLVSQSPRVGIRVTGFQWFESSAYKQGGGAFQVRFSKSTFPENMVLRPHHLEQVRSHESQPCQWRIVDIQDAEPQVGWCVMEPLTHHFTLTDNILVMNTSATIELREDEIEALGQAIHGAIARDEGYISAALLARFDAPFPRLPFEKIDRETYDRLHGEMLARRRVEDFTSALKRYDRGEMEEAGPAGCDSDKCLLPEVPPA